MTHTLLTGALVLDGDGSEPKALDLLIEGASIKQVFDRAEEPSVRTGNVVDLSGYFLAPGFIETHAHSDNSPLLGFEDLSKVLQGVTTEIVGNCGFSLAPINPATTEGFYRLVRRIFPSQEFEWNSYREYVTAIEQAGPITNYAMLVGHNSLRIAVKGEDSSELSRMEKLELSRLLDDALGEGAVGLSSGLIYPPGVFTPPDELGYLVSRLPSTAVYTSHMRNESLGLLDSISEILGHAVNSQAKVHISHLKFANKRENSLVPDALEVLQRSRDRGMRITQDLYPYPAAATMLTAVLPPWMHVGGSGRLLQYLKSEKDLDTALDQIENSYDFENFARAAGWDGVVIGSSKTGRFDGKSILELSHVFDLEPGYALARVLIEEDLQASMVVHAMREEDVIEILKDPFTTIGSDGLPMGTGGRPHPRTYGTFARILDRYVGQEKVISLPEAIRRMTSLPADIFGFTTRGRIKPGMTADLVAFKQSGVTDNATFADPVRHPDGIDHVFVNGAHVVRDGEWTGIRSGEVVRASH